MVQPPEYQIFLIDEDDAVRDSLKVLLESHCVQVRDFRDAAEFVAAKRAPSGHCLVLGYNRLTAETLNLVASLCQSGLDLPIVLIAGGQGETARAAALAAGAFACLERSVDEATLVRTIKATLKRTALRARPAVPDTAIAPA